MLPVRLSNQPRKFAMHVGKAGQAMDASRPRIDFTATDRRLGHVIEHEALPREACDKLGRYRKMFGVNQNVIGQIELFESGNASQKIWLQKEAIVGLALHDMANARPVSDFESGL